MESEKEVAFVRSFRADHLPRIRKVAIGGSVALGLVALSLFALHPDRLARLDWEDWIQFALILLAVPLIVLEAKGESTVRLVFSAGGMKLESSLPSWLRWGSRWRPWSVAWAQVKKVEIMRSFGVVRLIVPGRALPIALPLWGWSPVGQSRIQESAGWRSQRKVENSPIWQALSARGLIDGRQGVSTAIDFDLLAHGATRGGIIAAALLGGVGLVATITESETYIADGYGFLTPHVAAGAIGILLFWFVLAKVRMPSRLPAGIPIGLALVGGMGSAMFSYGTLVLANRVAAPAVPQRYVVGSPCTTLVPSDSSLPRIIWSTGFNDYWCQFKAGTEMIVPVRKGFFGTYQFDQGAYVEQIREWRKAKKRPDTGSASNS